MRSASTLAAATLGLGLAVGLVATPSPASAQQRNCVDVLAGMPDYSRFLNAMNSGHMVNTVRTMQNITIFAPNNAAIDKVPPGLVDRIFPRDPSESGRRDADPVLAPAAMGAHVIQGRFPAAALGQGVQLTTQAGNTLSFSRPQGSQNVQVSAGQNVTANVVQANIECANGVIHGIDAVLIR
ncbi:fasciclin domain-containing protein [Falsiroseomonas bella]|nr:fasciclin domain-containing protein [Falsiroseomonas bella]